MKCQTEHTATDDKQRVFSPTQLLLDQFSLPSGDAFFIIFRKKKRFLANINII
jgi:hypothetical protein